MIVHRKFLKFEFPPFQLEEVLPDQKKFNVKAKYD